MKTKRKEILPGLSDMVDLYIRVSTTEQAMEGYSVAEQEKRLRQYSEAMGYRIYRVHIDAGYSGASLDRPAIRDVIRDVKAGMVGKVIVWKLDRLSRSQKDVLIMLEDVFLANGCDFISMMESFDTTTAFGRAIVGILAAFSQLERENIKERTTMGKQARLAQGHYNGCRPPLGYEFLPGCNDLRVVPYEAAIVREIFSLFLSGTTAHAIAGKMAQKYPTLRTWEYNTVRRILQNYTYAGKVQDVDVIRDGIHEAIISETDFSTAQTILQRNKEQRKQGRVSFGLLTGLIYCGDCGARMQIRRVSKSPNTRRKYICYSVSRVAKNMIRSDHCTNRKHPYSQEDLECIVINEIKKLSFDSKYLDSLLHAEPETKTDTSDLYLDRLAEIEKQTDKLLNLYQIGVVEFPQIEERLSDLKKERDALKASMESQTPAAPAMEPSQILDYIDSFQKALDSGDKESVRNIIQLLIDKIVVLNENVEIHWTFC